MRLIVMIITIILTISPAVIAEPTPVKAIYGFSSKNAPFNSMALEEIPLWLHAHGFNAVFFYHNEDRDVLKTLHDHNISCYQEIAIFTGRSLYNEHPEWRPIGKDGNALRPDGWYHGLSPNQPDLRQKRLNELKSRLENPYLDGIWLDFIRYPVRWEGKSPRMEQACFSSESLMQFEKFLDKPLPDYESTMTIANWILTHHLEEWTAFKIHTIVSWVEAAKIIRDESRPDIKIGLFAVPWLQSDFDDAIHQIVAQDFEQLANHVDIMSPMVYHKLCYRDVEWIGNVTDAFQGLIHKPVWPIIQAVSDPVELTDNEFMQSMRIGLDHSEKGLIVFTAKHAENENRWDEIKTVLTEY